MDISLYYTIQGTGMPLILLHGNGERHEYFEHQIDYFSQYFQVIAIDTRGHGRSPRGTQPFTLEQFADDLYQFIQIHHIKKAHILGFSDGGNIALLFALKHQNFIDKLILDAANLYPEGLVDSLIQDILTEHQKAIDSGDHDYQELMELMLKEPHINPQALTSITVPTLVVAGNDDLILEEHTRLIYENLPNAQLAILEGTHTVAHDCPQKFNAIVHRFLS